MTTSSSQISAVSCGYFCALFSARREKDAISSAAGGFIVAAVNKTLKSPKNSPSAPIASRSLAELNGDDSSFHLFTHRCFIVGACKQARANRRVQAIRSFGSSSGYMSAKGSCKHCLAKGETEPILTGFFEGQFSTFLH